MRSLLRASLFVPLVLIGSLQAQDNIPDRWQISLQTGVFSPTSETVQDIYGSSAQFQLAAVAPLGRSGRMRLMLNRFAVSGDPFQNAPTFSAGDIAELTVNSAGISLETLGKQTYNPRVYLGLGVFYIFGNEQITGLRKGDAEGMGVRVSISPEFTISRQLSASFEMAYQFVKGKFDNGRDIYRLNLSGGSLMLGLGYHFRNRR